MLSACQVRRKHGENDSGVQMSVVAVDCSSPSTRMASVQRAHLGPNSCVAGERLLTTSTAEIWADQLITRRAEVQAVFGLEGLAGKIDLAGR